MSNVLFAVLSRWVSAGLHVIGPLLLQVSAVPRRLRSLRSGFTLHGTTRLFAAHRGARRPDTLHVHHSCVGYCRFQAAQVQGQTSVFHYCNVSSTLRMGWPACFLRPYYKNCVSFLKKKAEDSSETPATQPNFIWFQHSLEGKGNYVSICLRDCKIILVVQKHIWRRNPLSLYLTF